MMDNNLVSILLIRPSRPVGEETALSTTITITLTAKETSGNQAEAIHKLGKDKETKAPVLSKMNCHITSRRSIETVGAKKAEIMR